MKKIIVAFGMFFTVFATAQTKYEREYRIQPDIVPPKALSFIDSCFFKNTIRWYAEESQDGKTIEAKTKKNRARFSIEFDTLGNPIDIEKTIHFKTLPKEIKTNITHSLDSVFTKYTIVKTQIQWKADRQTLLSLMQEKASKDSYTTLYEIVIKGKREKNYHLYEVLIDPKGTIIKFLEIVQRNSDNIQF
ncbi:hypothetical protein [Aquimarina algiphila]|uniref:PepSY domain-containing protein n=1 Tax=Aquimarina algiphila TaxID=2047982 RepID=A0A554VRQ7_9FLAO|nr:hypothetical protein [Aquimarina algiphila]TSE11343.1 hypothetical protein FOF46_01555 [Aquimarina algiphila]